MATERERIDKMLAEGKVSAEEAERLRAALAKADAGGSDQKEDAITRPRLSRFALAAALSIPAAGGLFLMAFGFGIALGTRELRAAAGGLLVAMVVLAAGAALGIAAGIAVRREPDRLAGRRLARIAIVFSLLLGVSSAAGSFVTYENSRRRELCEPEEREIRALWGRTEYYVRKA
ncbi:MAG: hypothetical protein ACYTFI_08540, partial [Planctomycetota bacterium]